MPASTWGADRHGRPTTDSREVIGGGGALFPLGGAEEAGGYKGYGLTFLGKSSSGRQNVQQQKKQKSDLTLIEINAICEVPFYFINKIIIDKKIWLGTTVTETSKKKEDYKKKKIIYGQTDNPKTIVRNLTIHLKKDYKSSIGKNKRIHQKYTI